MLPTAALPLCWEATIKLRPVVRPSGVPFLVRTEFLTPLVWMVDDFVDQRFELEFCVKNTNSPKLGAVRSDQLNEKWEGQAGNVLNEVLEANMSYANDFSDKANFPMPECGRRRPANPL